MVSDQDHAEDPEPEYQGGVPIFPTPEEREKAERARQKLEEGKYRNEQRSVQWRMLYTQIAIVFLGLIGSGVSIWQATIAQDASDRANLLAQKGERDARINAERQLAETRREFESASASSQRQSEKALTQMESQTKAAQIAAQTAQDALTVSNRPWLSAEASIIDSPNSSGMTFDAAGNLGIGFTIKGKNFGKSIAQDIRIYGSIFASRSGNPWIKVPGWQSQICDHPNVPTLGPTSKTPFFQGFDRFPDETYEYNLTVTMDGDTVKRESSYYADDPAQRRYIERFYFVGCVDYASSFEGKRHQTRFAYDLIKKGRVWILPMNAINDPNHMRGNFEFEVGSSVPKDMLWLLPSLEGPIKAN